MWSGPLGREEEHPSNSHLKEIQKRILSSNGCKLESRNKINKNSIFFLFFLFFLPPNRNFIVCGEPDTAKMV
jgi:hypothetical protein